MGQRKIVQNPNESPELNIQLPAAIFDLADVTRMVSQSLEPYTRAVQNMQQALQPHMSSIAQMANQFNALAKSPLVESISMFQREAERVAENALWRMPISVPPRTIEAEEAVFVSPSPPRLTISEEDIERIAVAVAEKATKHLTVATQNSPKKKIAPLKLPPETRWEEISIRFLDGHDIEIKAGKNFRVIANYKDIGSQDERKRTPDKQWQLLQLLAANNGELTWDNPDATLKVKMKKHLLAQRLRVFFGIQDDPFYPYDKLNGYKTRFRLIPEPAAKKPRRATTAITAREQNDDFGAYYQEQVPTVYDPASG